MMKKIRSFLFACLTLTVFSCSNESTSKKIDSNNTSTIEERRTDYLQKRGWMAPEDMALFNKGVTPYEDREPWTEDKRKQAFIEKLKKLNVPDSTIQRIANEAEQIHGGRTGQWNYEYILARFEVYKNEMAKDEDWKKIENEYQNKLKTNH